MQQIQTRPGRTSSERRPPPLSELLNTFSSVRGFENSDTPTLSEVQLRNLHRGIYAAFERKPDSANILQGVRPFRKGKPHVRVVLSPSPKNGGAFIPCEGRLEAAMTTSLEIDPDVLRYRSQPIEIPSPAGRAYVPDFVAEHLDGTFTLIDVKPSGRLLDSKVTARMKYVRHALKEACLRHRIVTEVELEAMPARQIRDSLRKGSTVVLKAYDRHRLLEYLSAHPMPVGELRQHAISLGIGPACIEKLALLGDIRFPLITQWSVFAQLEVIHGTDQKPAAGRGTIHGVGVPL